MTPREERAAKAAACDLTVARMQDLVRQQVHEMEASVVRLMAATMSIVEAPTIQPQDVNPAYFDLRSAEQKNNDPSP